MIKKIRRIAGHRIALLQGTRYIASRPMDPPPGRSVTVTIRPMPGAPSEAEEIQITKLTREEADRLLNEFNNGSTSFDGRVW